MTVHQYAEWAPAATPDYDEAESARDAKAVLTQMFMRGAVPRRFHQNGRNETSTLTGRRQRHVERHANRPDTQ
jgi:hypothetical protein